MTATDTDRRLNAIPLLLRVGACSPLIFLGVQKVIHLQGYTNALEGLPYISGRIAAALAMPVAVGQIMVGVIMLHSRYVSLAAMLAGAYFLLSSAGIGLALYYQTPMWCACWTAFDTGRTDVAHLGAMVASALAYLCLPRLSSNLHTTRVTPTTIPYRTDRG